MDSQEEEFHDFYSIDRMLDDEGWEELLQHAQNDVFSDSDSDDEVFSNPEIDYESVSILGRGSKHELTVHERRAIVDYLLTETIGGKLPWGCITNAAKKFGVHRTTMQRIWKDVQKQRALGVVIDVRSKKFGKVGRKPKVFSEEWLQSVPLHLRTTIRSFAGYLKVSPSLIYRLLKKGLLRSHTSNNHPSLNENHKLARMKWVLSHILPATTTEPATFVDMENVIHIDEKWFYLNPDMRRFYLLPREDDPYRCQQSRRYKIKAMFMGLTSKPIYDKHGNMIHDGKYGIFPFVKKVAAKKSSKNRAAGTIETKPIEKITQEVIRDMLIEKVIPAIMYKWPPGLSKNIFIQQDNARPHIHPNDPLFRHVATQNGFNIQLICQPPQSPDLNVLDLGFFRAIQALQYQSFPKSLDDLIEKVQDAYDFFDPHVLKYTWLQLQWVMVEILKVKGGNNYKNPHHGKRKLERLGLLPENVQVEQSVIEESVKYLNERLIPLNENMEHDDDNAELDAN